MAPRARSMLQMDSAVPTVCHCDVSKWSVTGGCSGRVISELSDAQTCQLFFIWSGYI